MEQDELSMDLKNFADPDLTPGDPERCLGNGNHGYECCCDNCDHYLACFPEWDEGGAVWHKYDGSEEKIEALHKFLDEFTPKTEADVDLINRVVDTLNFLEGVDADEVNKASETW